MSAGETFVERRVGRKGVPTARSFARWVDATLHGARRRGEVSIAILGRAEARKLNRQFRGKDYATNVLSFPCEAPPGRRTRLLGDLAICAPVVAREAREQGKPINHHYAHLTVHGVLHLVGYDHERERDAERMESLERRVLAGLGISDPYA
ncbi:MAG TPA: rRNA maturation RNase YbeY [Rudaea sp.]|nr:rRNA maturation RNase YbeY [Rudaea sp.]